MGEVSTVGLFGLTALALVAVAALAWLGHLRMQAMKQDRPALNIDDPGLALALAICGLLIVGFMVWMATFFWALLVLLVFCVERAAHGLAQWRRDRRPVRISTEGVLALGLTVGWMTLFVAVEPSPLSVDHLRSIPASASSIPSCPASVIVPDVGNEMNSSAAGATSLMVVGSKVYVTDVPAGPSARQSIRLEGAATVCATADSNFGEAMIATAPGTTTVYVARPDGSRYRFTVTVAQRH